MYIEDQLEIKIITCNRGNYLNNTLEKLLESPLRYCDITILDNSSNDNTGSICMEYCKNYDNVSYIRHQLNIGGNGNIVNAFKHFKGKPYKWVLCDDDNLNITEEGIEELKKAIYKNYDLISMANYLLPKDYTYEQLMKQFCFLPSFIHRTDLLDNDTIQCMNDSIYFMLPHLAFYINCFNQNKSIKVLNSNFIQRGMDFDNPLEYQRTRNVIHPFRKDMSWVVGFFNSLMMLNNAKIRNRIMSDYLIYVGNKNVFGGILFELNLNRNYYNNCLKNILDLFACFDNNKRFLLILALLVFPFIKKFNVKNTPEGFAAYFKQKGINKNLQSFFKNKKNVIIYGGGRYFDGLIINNGDLIRKNVKIIADSKFPRGVESEYKGFIAINPKDIEKYNPEIILVAVFQFEMIKNLLKNNGMSVKIIPLVKQSILEKLFSSRV